MISILTITPPLNLHKNIQQKGMDSKSNKEY